MRRPAEYVSQKLVSLTCVKVNPRTERHAQHEGEDLGGETDPDVGDPGGRGITGKYLAGGAGGRGVARSGEGGYRDM